mmetsp:Transcript_1218/g.3863  ORF Transcript_1218/g.3863 Transcript_1218/m.3863 type:complete len:217 (-) Transcript_1218:343-993(-)
MKHASTAIEISNRSLFFARPLPTTSNRSTLLTVCRHPSCCAACQAHIRLAIRGLHTCPEVLQPCLRLHRRVPIPRIKLEFCPSPLSVLFHQVPQPPHSSSACLHPCWGPAPPHPHCFLSHSPPFMHFTHYKAPRVKHVGGHAPDGPYGLDYCQGHLHSRMHPRPSHLSCNPWVLLHAQKSLRHQLWHPPAAPRQPLHQHQHLRGPGVHSPAPPHKP